LRFEATSDYLEQHLSDYFAEDLSGKRLYQGQHFEWFIERSDPTIFTPHDALAVSALSYTLPANAVRELLDQSVSDRLGKPSPNDLLTKCWQVIGVSGVPDIRTCPAEWIESPASPFVELYERLLEVHGVGDVAASKLMAAKFPALMPIWDDKVAGLMYQPDEMRWWVPMRQLLTRSAGAVPAVLDALDLGRDDITVGTLRRLDVVLWMEASARKVSFRELSSERL
jgi:hypothetical protein